MTGTPSSVGGVRPLVRNLLYGITRSDLLSAGIRRLGTAGVLPDAVSIRLPADRTFEVACPPGRFLYRSTRHDLIGRRLHWQGLRGMEWGTMRVFREVVASRATFLDVGANTGLYSLVAATVNPALRGIAFEPVPRVRERLIENLALNGLSGRIAVSEEAVGAEAGRATFHVPFVDVPTSASLNPDGFRGCAGERIEVELTTVDRVRERLGASIGAMKIDVEGFEHEVLRGAGTCLREDHPVVFLECHPDGPGRAITEVLKPLGYTFHVLRDDGPTRVESVGERSSAAAYNFLCVPGTLPSEERERLGLRASSAARTEE